MKGLLMTLDERVPKWTLEESRIGINPGLGFRPMSTNISYGSLIWYQRNETSSVKEYTDVLDRFLERMLHTCFLYT